MENTWHDPTTVTMELTSENKGDLPAAERVKALRAMFASWQAEDATDDPQELARRPREWEQLKTALNANRTSGRKLFDD
jgi:hypothetical protein